jgi:hypothetical protein
MHYLVYVSQARRPMDEAELEAILIPSRAANPALGITGLLVYRYSPDTDSGHFIQMLEGEESAVRALYDRIVRDPRHHTKLVLGEGEIPARMFANWSMGFKNVDDALFARLPGYARLGAGSFDAKEFQNSNHSALDLLKFFYDAP